MTWEDFVFGYERPQDVFRQRSSSQWTGRAQDPREGKMTNGVASWRRQENWRSKTQVGWLALNRKTPHPLRLQGGKQDEWLAGDLRVRMSGN